MKKEEIARILKELRNAANMKRKDVADSIGVSVKTVGHWETGYAQPDADTLFRLCDMYGTSVDEAFGFRRRDGADAIQGRIIESHIDNKQLNDAIQKCIDLPENFRQIVFDTIDRLYNSTINED